MVRVLLLALFVVTALAAKPAPAKAAPAAPMQNPDGEELANAAKQESQAAKAVEAQRSGMQADTPEAEPKGPTKAEPAPAPPSKDWSPDFLTTGDCCYVKKRPITGRDNGGCTIPSVEKCVYTFDRDVPHNHSCKVLWDGECVELAVTHCGIVCGPEQTHSGHRWNVELHRQEVESAANFSNTTVTEVRLADAADEADRNDTKRAHSRLRVQTHDVAQRMVEQDKKLVAEIGELQNSTLRARKAFKNAALQAVVPAVNDSALAAEEASNSAKAGGKPRNTCCSSHSRPGCSMWAVETCVCRADPFCCEMGWDKHCVALIKANSCGGDKACPARKTTLAPPAPSHLAGDSHRPRQSVAGFKAALTVRVPVEARVNEYLAGVWNSSKFDHSEAAEAALSDKIDKADIAERESSLAQEHVRDQLAAIMAMQAPNSTACYPNCHPVKWYLPEGLQLDRPLASTAARIMDSETMSEEDMVNRILRDPLVSRSRAGWEAALSASRRAFNMLKVVRQEQAEMKKSPETDKALPAEFKTAVADGVSAAAASVSDRKGTVFPLWTTQEAGGVALEDRTRTKPTPALDKSAIHTANANWTASLARRNGLKGKPGDVVYDWVKVQKVLVLGDESACGTCSSPEAEGGTGSFVKRLQSVLQTEKFNVQNFCQPDATAENVLGMPTVDTIFGMSPDVIAIMLGTNDAKLSNWQGAQAYESALKTLVRTLKSRFDKPPRVVLMTPPPVYPGQLIGLNVTAANEEVPPAVERVRGALKLPPVVDVFQILGGRRLDRPSMVCDGVHPTDEAVKKIAMLLSAAVKP